MRKSLVVLIYTSCCFLSNAQTPKTYTSSEILLQLKKLNAQLTELSDQQAAYIHVSKQGPYKPDTYRY